MTTPEIAVAKEQELRRLFGFILLKPDAIDLGVEEYLTNYISERMQAEAGASLAGVIIIPPLTVEQVEQIYPCLDENYFQAYCKILSKSESILLIYDHQYSEELDLWATLKSIRGKVNEGFGFKDSIRAAIPIPGDRLRYDQITAKLATGSLSPDDYVALSANLVHTPEDIHEIAGLFFTINDNRLHGVFGKKRYESLKKDLQPYLMKRPRNIVV